MASKDLERFRRIEKNIEFIVEQQARFSTDMQQIRDVLYSHSEAIASAFGVVGKLADAQTVLASRMEQVEARMAELATAGKETEERLNAFITFVEKYISGRNGGKQNR